MGVLLAGGETYEPGGEQAALEEVYERWKRELVVILNI
jgi:hypothetical protein